LGKLACKEIECKPFEVYELISENKDRVLAVVSGIGKIKASSATTWAIMKFSLDKVVNMGTCGATLNAATDKVVRITEVVNRDFDLSILYGASQKSPKLVLKKSSSPTVLYTADHFTLNANVFGYFDMEGYAVAEVAQSFGVKCELIKVVTDVIDSGTQNNQFGDNLNSASQKLNDELKKYVAK